MSRIEFMPINRRAAAILAIPLATLTLANCSNDNDAQTDQDRATACLNNDMNGRSATSLLSVEGEAFDAKISYSTNYDVKSWKITDTKTLDIKVEVVPDEGAKLPTILIDNLHADASIKATSNALNGLPADSFDDHVHGNLPGFAVSTDHPYTESFVISGFSETLLSGWGFVAGGFGSSSLNEERLNEKTLKKHGAYGEQVAVVIDFAMRNSVDEAPHKVVVSDAIIIPLEGYDCSAPAANTTTTTQG